MLLIKLFILAFQSWHCRKINMIIIFLLNKEGDQNHFDLDGKALGLQMKC